MTIVYVLTSTQQDYYKEQFLISVYSLRRANSQRVALLTDDKTAPLLDSSVLQKLRVDLIVIPFDNGVSMMERSRLIKTSIPKYVDVPFLYLDCDTVVCADLSPIEALDCKVGGVLDCHVPINAHIHRRYFLKRDKRLGFQGTRELGYNINGGFLWCKDAEATKTLFSKWHDLWIYSAYTKKDFHDQSALNEAIFQTGNFVSLLDGAWNCQLEHGGLEYLLDAKILHYYSSEQSGRDYVPYYKIADPALWQEVRQNGFTAHLCYLVANAKFVFYPTHLVTSRRAIGLLQSPVFFTLADIRERLPRFFGFLENCTEVLRVVAKKLIKR